MRMGNLSIHVVHQPIIDKSIILFSDTKDLNRIWYIFLMIEIGEPKVNDSFDQDSCCMWCYRACLSRGWRREGLREQATGRKWLMPVFCRVVFTCQTLFCFRVTSTPEDRKFEQRLPIQKRVLSAQDSSVASFQRHVNVFNFDSTLYWRSVNVFSYYCAILADDSTRRAGIMGSGRVRLSDSVMEKSVGFVTFRFCMI